MNMCGMKLEVLWDDRNLSSPLLSSGSLHGLAMSHDMTAYAKLSCKALLKVDAGGDNNARLGSDNVKAWMDISALQLLTAAANRASWSRLSAYASALRSPNE